MEQYPNLQPTLPTPTKRNCMYALFCKTKQQIVDKKMWFSKSQDSKILCWIVIIFKDLMWNCYGLRWWVMMNKNDCFVYCFVSFVHYPLRFLLLLDKYNKSWTSEYSVVSIKRTGSLNYFEVFFHPVLFFHVLKKNFAPPCSFFLCTKKKFAPPCSLITSCSLNRYYRVNCSKDWEKLLKFEAEGENLQNSHSRSEQFW